MGTPSKSLRWAVRNDATSTFIAIERLCSILASLLCWIISHRCPQSSQATCDLTVSVFLLDMVPRPPQCKFSIHSCVSGHFCQLLRTISHTSSQHINAVRNKRVVDVLVGDGATDELVSPCIQHAVKQNLPRMSC